MLRFIIFIAVLVLVVAHDPADAYNATWIQASKDGGFPGRDTARIVKFKNRIIMSGGYQYGGKALLDLYYSGDGANWNLFLSETPFPAYTPLAVHRGKIIAVGKDTIRSTIDLINYNTIAKTPFSDDSVEAPLIGDFKDKLWLILADKIRYSVDGRSWKVAKVPWKKRLTGLTAIKHDGYIYIFGGSKLHASDNLPEQGYDFTMVNKVWRTTDPIKGRWSELKAPWGARLWPQAVSHNGSIYVVAGYNNVAAKNYDDVWKCSTDMRCKRLSTAAIYIDPEEGRKKVSYQPRHWPAVFSFNGVIWMCGGNTNPDGPGTVNDCWYLQEN